MARDVRVKKSGLDRNKYYKASYVDNMKLTKDATVQGVFYSTDYEPLRTSFVVNGSMRHKQTTVKLETMDFIEDMAPDDFVLYNGELYIVEDIITEDLRDSAKPFSRHSNKYIISLRR